MLHVVQGGGVDDLFSMSIETKARASFHYADFHQALLSLTLFLTRTIAVFINFHLAAESLLRTKARILQCTWELLKATIVLFFQPLW